MSENKSFVQAGKKTREELRLPQLHFIVADDWIDKLGEKTFCYWLKLLSLVDRTDEAEYKYGNKSTIPRSLEDLYEKFNMSKSTFYRNIIHPLWNYGLIDIVEWSDSKKIGTKPKNIIVYEYPQNSYELAIKPLTKCRDYSKDYNSESAIFGRIGGALRKDEKNTKETRKDIKTIKAYRFKNETLSQIKVLSKNLDISNRFKNETLTVSKMKPLTVLKLKPINYTNTLVNDTNTLVNRTNDFLKKEEEENNNITTKNMFFEKLANYLKEKSIDQETIEKTLIECEKIGLDFFRLIDVEKQFEHMMNKLETNQVDNHNNFAKYFANGLKDRTIQTSAKIKQSIEREKKQKEEQDLIKKRKEESKDVYFNWLDS